MNDNGYILHEDDERVVIVTGVTTDSNNTKTGGMLQIWILVRGMSPVEAIKQGEDGRICGDCPARGDGFEDRWCYVEMKAPQAIWHCYERGNYARLPLTRYADVFYGRATRFGAYGDPVHIPLGIVRRIVLFSKKYTGYTHQWRQAQYQAYREYFMASVETPKGMIDAKTAGWRTFRVRRADERLEANEITCPASDEAGHRTQCERCGLCGGARIDAKSIVLIVHGKSKQQFVQLQAA